MSVLIAVIEQFSFVEVRIALGIAREKFQHLKALCSEPFVCIAADRPLDLLELPPYENGAAQRYQSCRPDTDRLDRCPIHRPPPPGDNAVCLYQRGTMGTRRMIDPTSPIV